MLAENAIKSGGKNDQAVLSYISERLISREFTADESKIVNATLADLRTDYKAKPDEAKKLIAFGDSKPDAKLDPAELAAWTMLANQLLNLDEVLNK